MIGRALTSSSARPRVFRGPLSSCLPLLAVRATIMSLVFRPGERAARPAFRKKFEAQRAGNRRCFHQFYCYGVAKPVGFAGTRANHGVACFVVPEIFVTDGAGGDEPIGAGFAQFHEKARTCDAGDAAFEARADTIGEKMCDQPVV